MARKCVWKQPIKDDVQEDELVLKAAYHASLQNELSEEISLGAMLLLFKEQAHSPAMIRHSMTIVRKAVQFLNLGQIPIVSFDRPFYVISRQVTIELANFVLMLGGLHVEMAVFKDHGGWLDDSGWTDGLVQAVIAKSYMADSFLKASQGMLIR